MEPSSTMAPFIIIPIVFVSLILFVIIIDWCCIYKLKLKNPSDARRLPPDESKHYLDLIQGKDVSVTIWWAKLKMETFAWFLKKIAGLWEITPIETPSGGCCTPVPPVYGKMYVSGQKMTFSGKSDGSSSVQTTYINMHKSSNGTLYMDKFGTIMFDFSPEAGTFKLNKLKYEI